MVPVKTNQNWLPSIFNDFFDNEWMARANATAPAINVIENEKDYKVELAAPGMTKNDFKVSVDESNNLVICMEKKDEKKEDTALFDWVASLPAPYNTELAALYTEMGALQTDEAKLYKALDKLEAVIQHNESDIRSWEPLEYDLNRTYAYDAVAFSPYLTKLREAVREDTEEKIKAAEK